MSIPKEGTKAPNFIAPSSLSKDVSLKEFFQKRHVVLYFYPKDDTPGCTTEACGFRDDIPAVEKHDAVIIGVSPDSVKKHMKFIEKYSLPFPLLADEDKKICETYGVWVEKSMYGRKYMGVARTTFVIDKEGIIVKVFEKVKPKDHSKEVLEVLKNL
ncbi:MAG: thioredoxin-dependent thiol peroxidase [Candidatus Omnitrophica bacterium]|nr:thioredoxin-dependent thiol peroxidase [Candidatus Omnitrophota bacterium]